MSDYSGRYDSIETNVVHAGTPSPRIGGAVVTPIFQSANYQSAGEANYDDIRYIRLSNSPNHLTLHARLAVIESGEAALVASSGMAAITSTLMSFLGSGDHLLAQKTLYGGTQGFLDEDAPRLGIRSTPIDTADPDGPAAWERALTPTTRLILLESISNPLMEVGDLEAVVEFARARGLVTVIDNTFATPVNFRPLEIGIDVVVHSATKYLNGHSDLVAGAVVASAEHLERIRARLVHFGGSLDPNGCFLLERGLKTLVLRVQRQNATAGRLAALLDEHPAVRKVNYPGLASDPGHRFARKLFDGFGGMLSFYADTAARAERFLERVRIPVHAASLGGPESLVVRPARTSHLGLEAEERERLEITDDLVRVSVGIENADELAADFTRALE